MLKTLLNSKIHRAKVTGADLNYVGSITIDKNLMRMAEIIPYELVHVVDVTNGSRLQTYAIPGEAGSGKIEMNGAAAHLIKVNDIIIIMSFIQLTTMKELNNWKPKVVFVDQQNKPISKEAQFAEHVSFCDTLSLTI